MRWKERRMPEQRRERDSETESGMYSNRPRRWLGRKASLCGMIQNEQVQTAVLMAVGLDSSCMRFPSCFFLVLVPCVCACHQHPPSRFPTPSFVFAFTFGALVFLFSLDFRTARARKGGSSSMGEQCFLVKKQKRRSGIVGFTWAKRKGMMHLKRKKNQRQKTEPRKSVSNDLFIFDNPLSISLVVDKKDKKII